MNSEVAETYLLGFKDKGAEYIENSMDNKDEVLSRDPIVKLGLILNNGKEKTLTFYLIPLLDEEIQDQLQGIDKYLNQNILRYIAQDENGDLFLVQYEVFKDLFVNYKWFLKK
ncbi:MAG: hypothetical protein R2771_04535 [Saprospiraceae bacterium]